MDTEYSNSELDSDEVDFESSALIESQKIKTKAKLKRKMKGGSDFDSSSLDEEKVMYTVSDVVNEIPKDKTKILKEKPNDKPKGVTHKLPCVNNLKDKVSDIVKEKPKDKPKGVTDKAPCVHNVKDKVLDIVVKSRVLKDKVSDIVNNFKDKCKTELPKDKAKDKTKSVVKSKVPIHGFLRTRQMIS
nr:hypothetical protein [Tanacetum cinerariifolium]